MKGFQKSYLRGIGQRLRPTINVGKKGIDDGFLTELNQLFERHELLKVKFTAFKDEKRTLALHIAEKTGSIPVGIVGHTALFYRRNPDPEKREIRVPERPEEEQTDPS